MNIRLASVFCFAVVAGLFLLGAQSAPVATVQVTQSPEYGAQLTDGEGMSLYLYLEDQENTSTCYDACVRNWPPLLVAGEPVAGEGVDAALLGTVTRTDGTVQVTYNGRPLYRFARDAKPGDTRGHGLGNVFFLVSAAGEVATEQEVEVVLSEAEQALLAELKAAGGAAFASNCAVCHGDQGQGQIGPRLAGNSNLERADFLVGRILNGFIEHGMPPFRHLSDREVASIATFVRNSWTNEFGLVTEEEVAAQR